MLPFFKFSLPGMLHRTQEEDPDPEEVPADPHQEEGSGEAQPHVQRHQLQVRTRKVPDPPVQGRLHRTPQEGTQGVEVCSCRTELFR